MKYSSILNGIVILIIGLGLGYAIGSRQPQVPVTPISSLNGTHQMPDGSVMGNGMHDAMADMTSSLKNKTGDDFDKAFLDEMVVHHQGAIDMANLVLTTSKRPELLELARNIITAQTQEITMMNDWRSAWFK